MTQFAIYAALVVFAALVLLLPVLWFGKRNKATAADRKEANLAIFRDQLADLEREFKEEVISQEEFEQAHTELKRRLLEEVDGETDDRAAAWRPTSRPTAVALLLLLPLAAILGYLLLGNPKALDPANTAPQKQMTADDINAMVARLAARMETNPDDLNGWAMLGRSYKMLGRYDEAVAAYGKAETLIDQDPELLASYAETLAMASGKGLTGKAKEQIDKALKLDPKHAHTLFLAGAAAMEAGDAKNAIAYWEALLPQVEPGSELDQMLRAGIEQMKQAK
ncbi:c-type cytochrome biogenesis protein CcmI [uncultured Azonexus sp.]|uniref:c-type cytochrome biogenesis protein CcmI n=1 Tax=uncultured Azonexus sp. TaxID=520307 RepID=UPI00260242C3|nr:c-type cytochrome biogenesis protein CcmI [uncultured Azonexus sp.]